MSGDINPQRIWQVPEVAVACNAVTLTQGMIVFSPEKTKELTHPYAILPTCIGGQPTIYQNLPGMMLYPPFLMVSTTGWEAWHHADGEYSKSVPVIVTIGSVAVTLALIIAVFISGGSKRHYPLIIRIASYYALMHLLVMFSIMLKIDHEDYDNNFSSSFDLSDRLFTKQFTIAGYVSAILLLLAQVRVAMELYDRPIEKRLTLIVGSLFVVSALSLRGVAEYGVEEDIVPDIIEYLFEMGLYILFSGSVFLKCIGSRKAAFSSEMAPFTVLATLVSILPAAYFLADLAGWWVGRMIDRACQISNLITVVVVWYWTQALADTKQTQEDQYALGRRLYGEDGGGKDLYFTDTRSESDETNVDASSTASVIDGDKADSHQRPATAEGHHPRPPSSWRTLTQITRAISV